MDRMNNNMNNKVRLGFGTQIDNYLKRFDNAAADPDIQTFSNEDDEEPETRQYFCAMCRSHLQYHKHLSIWICPECFQQYDLRIQDRPIANKHGFNVTPHHDINRYAKLDNDDTNVPFMKGIDLTEQQDNDIEILRTSQNERIQYIKLRDNCTREEAYNKTRNL